MVRSSYPVRAGRALSGPNELASEHLTVDGRDVALVRNAGSVFVGDYSAQAAGDYASGSNHVLPTGAAARFRGGLSEVLDFEPPSACSSSSPGPDCNGLRAVVECLADAEGLRAHADSVRIRVAHA